MKPTQPVSTILAAAALALLLTSCAKEEAHSGLEPEPERGDVASAPKVVATPEVQRKVTDDSNQQRLGGILDERHVFFEFDKSLVRVEYLPVVNAHTDFLVVNRNKTIILEGHADERGSNEYNLALGLRRSQAVNEIMVAGGVFADQIEMISYGEERPRALGSNEAAWAENRRVRIVYSDE